MATLGVVLPDDGPQRYEWYDLDGWLAERGLDGPQIRIAGSCCDGLHTVESLLRTGSQESLAEPARRLGHQEGAGAVVWACTSGSFIGGLQWAREQAAGLRAASGRPAVSTALALADAIAALGADTVDLLSPYPKDVSAHLIGFLGDLGIAVAKAVSLDCPTSGDSHVLDLESALTRLPWASRPVVIPDTAVDTLRRLPALEALARRPVVTANQATLWAGLRLLGLPAAIAEAGLLLAPERQITMEMSL